MSSPKKTLFSTSPLEKVFVLMVRAPTSSARCPNCAKRASLRDHDGVQDCWDRYEVVTWQCVYCGAVCEPSVRGFAVTGFAPIVFRPGELEAIRKARGAAS